VIRQHSGIVQRLARAALAAFAFVAIASCGNGGVNPPPDFTAMTILPATATTFSGVPTTFVISGGITPYAVVSDNQSVIPLSGATNMGTLVVVANDVASNTVVNLTVRDSSTVPLQAVVGVTVQPSTVANEITIVPTTTQGGACAPAVCSGGDALVGATLSLRGLPLSGRPVRFDVLSGSFRFITSFPGAQVETLDVTSTTVSDTTGKAFARLRVAADAPNQTALLRVTDVVSGAFKYATFIIAQATGSSPGFFVTPSSITFRGARTDQCASGNTGIGATFFVFGGAPPYTVSNTTTAFALSTTFVPASGGSFFVTPNGTCVAEPGVPIIVRDASGRTTTVLAANIPGTAAVPPLVVAPTAVTLTSCTSQATVTVAGGTGNYSSNTLSGGVFMFPSNAGNVFAIQRLTGSPSPGPSGTQVEMAISDGVSAQTVTVTLTGAGAGPC
jgi:hypothetical protein